MKRKKMEDRRKGKIKKRERGERIGSNKDYE